MAGGIYQLVLRLGRARVIRIGRLGRFVFPAGHYVYTGSGGRAREKRIARHLLARPGGRCRKKMRWHIDYLRRWCEVTWIWRGEANECARNRWTARLPGARVPVRGFGSSDCRCPAHLCFFGRLPQALARSMRVASASDQVAKARAMRSR